MNKTLDLKRGDFVVEKGTDNVPRKIYEIYEDVSDSRYVIFCNGEFCRTKEEFESKYERFSPVIDVDNPSPLRYLLMVSAYTQLSNAPLSLTELNSMSRLIFLKFLNR